MWNETKDRPKNHVETFYVFREDEMKKTNELTVYARTKKN